MDSQQVILHLMSPTYCEEYLISPILIPLGSSCCMTYHQVKISSWIPVATHVGNQSYLCWPEIHSKPFSIVSHLLMKLMTTKL